MSKKHFDEYYAQVCAQYEEMKKVSEELSKECERGVVSPEQVENMKAVCQPLRDNFQIMSWVAYLLNQPNKKSKIKAYEKRNKALTKNLDKKHCINNKIEENNQVISKLKEGFK